MSSPIAVGLALLLCGCPVITDDLANQKTIPVDTAAGDSDGDGFTSGEGDCNDVNAAIHPDADEICDGQDNDCDGAVDDEDEDVADPTTWYADDDGDTYGQEAVSVASCISPPGYVTGGQYDCDDTNDEVHPGASELCATTADDDCDGDTNNLNAAGCSLYYLNEDGDGYGTAAQSCLCEAQDNYNTQISGDCDDSDTAVFPGAVERCNGRDDDCDGTTPSNETDDDADAFVECSLDTSGWNGTSAVTGWEDCNDSDATVYPGATELCDGQVNTCGGSLPLDEADDDTDGYVECTIDSGGWDGVSSVTGGDDCVDTDGYTFPGAAAYDSATDCMTDADGDGWGQTSPATGVVVGTDCDDTEATLYPGASELCDGQINNCNTSSMPGDEIDDDADGYVECTIDSGGWDGAAPVTGGQDCNDTDATTYTGASELCDGQINNCNTSSMPGDEIDDDADGYVECTIDTGGWDGAGTAQGNDCDDADPDLNQADADADGISSCDGDCNDNDPTIYPWAAELCDGQDNDCDSALPADETDDDSDGYVECTLDTSGWDGDSAVTGWEDCDDSDSTVLPGATEICDGQVNNCGGSLPADEVDDDADGYVECSIDSGGWDGASNVSGGGDCVDTDGNTHPGAASSESTTDCMTDADGDGWGDPIPATGVVAGTDCDDTEATFYPGASELCDGQINNCNTSSMPGDEIDDDADGYVECTIDTGGWDGVSSVIGGDDCDILDDTIYPGAPEICDGLVNTCGGSLPADESDADADGYVECTIDSEGWEGASITGGDDCDDTDPGTVNDMDCDGSVTVDDCNDNDADIYSWDRDGDGNDEGCGWRVSAGGHHTCGITSSGSVECWGWDYYGQSSPLSDTFQSVSGGGYHTCGITSSGSVECWGRDGDGQSSPLSGTFESVSAGWYHTCGVTSSGSVECWGRDTYGQASPPSGTFESVSAGGNHTCGVTSSGSVECWGDDNYGQSTPPAGTFESVSAGSYHTCGVTSGGSVECWGWDHNGQATPSLGSFDSVSAGYYHTCGVTSSGSVECWGWDGYGQSNPPTGTFQSVSAGWNHTCGITSSGSVECWGIDDGSSDDHGQVTDAP